MGRVQQGWMHGSRAGVGAIASREVPHPECGCLFVLANQNPAPHHHTHTNIPVTVAGMRFCKRGSSAQLPTGCI